MDRKQFLEEMFGDKPSDYLISTMIFPDKSIKFFKTIDDVDAYAEKNKTGKNVYFGTNMLDKHPTAGRGSAKDSAGAVCFYMDVDIDTTSNAHAKTDLPGSVADATSLVTGNGFDPSIIVHSGYGLHAYWLFKEPWLFDVDSERESYHKLALQLQATIKAKAAKSGWRLDSTADTARILRMPDTQNVKIPDKPAQVSVIVHNKDTIGETLRYDPYSIEQFLVDEDLIKKTVLSDDIKFAIYNDLVLSADASPPQDKLEQLCEIEENFAKTWKAKRQKLGNDPSAYAMSLCNYAARAGWTRQEMANLIIGFYRKHLNNPLFTNRPGREPISMSRIMRISKIATTIGKAIIAAQEDQAKVYEEDIEPTESTGMSDMVDPTGERALQYLSTQLRLEVIEINRYVPEEDKDVFFEMIVKRDGKTSKVTFRNVDEMLKQDNFRKRVINCINYPPRRVDKENWGKIEQTICKVAKTISVSPATESIEGKMSTWLSQFVEGRPSGLTPVQGYRSNQSFVDGGFWHIFAKPFNDWIFANKGMTDGLSRTTISLKRIGAEEVRFNRASDDGKGRIFFRAWRIPHTILIPPPTVVVDNTKREPGDDDEPFGKAETVS